MTEMNKLLINYYENCINLKINEKYKRIDLVLSAINHDNIKIVKLLIKNAEEHKEILELNEKDHKLNYPLLSAINNNNIEMVKLLIKYANKHNEILELNDKNNNGAYPLFYAVDNNNIKWFIY